MCILLATTASEEYPLILASNRDEFYIRPTDTAKFRTVNNKTILSPADLGRPEHGTWIGVDTSGKLAVLVNFRESNDLNIISDVSRGILPVDYLASDLDDETWYENLETSLASRIPGNEDMHIKQVPLKRVGGFSLFYGHLKLDGDGKLGKFNIISNRGHRDTVFNATNETIGLSNSLYDDPWPKVDEGRKLLADLASELGQYDQEALVQKIFGVLSTDTFEENLLSSSMNDKLIGLRDTIFVPPLETLFDDSQTTSAVGKYYGTRTQTVILLDKSGGLHYYENNIHHSDTFEEPNPSYSYHKVDLTEEQLRL